MAEYIEPTAIKISNLTLTSKITGISSPLNLKQFYEKVPLKEGGIVYIKYLDTIRSIMKKKSKRNKDETEPVKKKKFKSIFLKVNIMDEKNITFQVFDNSSLHITGSRDIDNDAIGAIKKLIQIFEEVNEENQFYEKEEDLNYEPIEIQSINSNFYSNFTIDLDNLDQILKHNFEKKNSIGKYILSPSFEKTNYPGINLKIGNIDEETTPYKTKKGMVKIKRRITLLIFSTGKILITGANKHEYIDFAYNFINNIFKKFYKYVHLSK